MQKSQLTQLGEKCSYLLDTPSNGLSSVMTGRVIQGQQALSAAPGNTQGAESTAGVLCDLLSTLLSDFTGIPGLLDNNLQQIPHIRVLQTMSKKKTLQVLVTGKTCIC